MKRLVAAVALLAIPAAVVAAGPPAARPMIWVTQADRAPILAKIESQSWAKDVFAAMEARVKDAVEQHRANPESYLRELPLLLYPANGEVHPTFLYLYRDGNDIEPDARAKLQRILQIGVDCGVLYFLTQDESYASVAADILHVFVEAIVQMTPSGSLSNGGLIYPDDHLFEARVFSAQIPLIYDFVHSYLNRGGTVFSLATRRQATFNFEHAQTVFRTYANLAIEHGHTGSNWSVLEMPSLAHNVLALDDAAERARLLAYVTEKDTDRQDSLKTVLAQFARPGDVWPESFQYSNGVSSLATYVVALMQRQDQSSELPEGFVNIPISLPRLREFLFPNSEYVRFGDGPRRVSDPYDSYEIAYALGQRIGDARLRETSGSLINLGLASGEYSRNVANGHITSASAYLGPVQLLWFSPEISGEMAEPEPRTTDELPFVGAVLQRNLSPDNDPAHALMAFVYGGHHVHGHASGMALELYGVGEVLGANAGAGTYRTDEHENYRRIFAGHNSVIVNGASQSEGGWVNLGINTVRKVALEPAVTAAPVSPRHSFSVTQFEDDKGPYARARQERTIGIVRTSDRTGYYVDVFRSQSELPSQFHDYVYHNIGESATISTANGELELAGSPDRFPPVPGSVWTQNRAYFFPGWHYFEEPRTSAPFPGDVTVDFVAERIEPEPAHMRLFVLGEDDREYSLALAPETRYAPDGYAQEQTPVLVIRQRGEAWTRPFAVIYEPFAGAEDSGSINSVSALGEGAEFTGFKVVSNIEGRAVTQYVLVPPTATSVFEDQQLGIYFSGRYAVITLNERDECEALYLGEGSRLRFQDIELSSVSGRPSAAFAELSGGTATLTSNGPVELILPGGERITSGVGNAASYEGGAVAAGEIVTIFGDSMGPPELVRAQLTPDGQYFANSLAGTRVLFDSDPAPLIYTSKTQLSTIVPFGVAGKESTDIRIEHNGAFIGPLSVPVVPALPGIFTLDASGRGQAAALHWPDYSVNGAENPAKQGSVVMVYATSGGLLSPPGEDGKVVTEPQYLQLPVSATVGGVTAEMNYAGAAPGLVTGVLQVNIKIPDNAPSGDSVPLVINVGGVTSQPDATLAIQDEI